MSKSRIEELVSVSERNLLNTHPLLRRRTLDLITLLGLDGLYFAAFMGFRSKEVQHAIYMQGRASLDIVNSLRAVANMSSIGLEENKKKVTQLDFGYHNLGLAVDLVEDGDVSRAGVQWSWSNNADYLKVGSYAKAAGVSWGGFWKAFKDYPHVELTGGISLETGRMLLQTGGLPAVWREVDRLLLAA